MSILVLFLRNGLANIPEESRNKLFLVASDTFATTNVSRQMCREKKISSFGGARGLNPPDVPPIRGSPWWQIQVSSLNIPTARGWHMLL